MIGETIAVRYSCRCVKDRVVNVGARRADQDAAEWMSAIRVEISFDHAMTSPDCEADRFDVMIPIAGDRVGEPPKEA